MPGPRSYHWEEWSWDLNSVCLTTSSKFSALLAAKALCESPDTLLPSSMCHLPCVWIQPVSSSIIIVPLPAQKPPEATVRRRPLSLALRDWLNLSTFPQGLPCSNQVGCFQFPASCLCAGISPRIPSFFLSTCSEKPQILWILLIFESVSISLFPLNYHFTWYIF